jgi:galactokinase
VTTAPGRVNLIGDHTDYNDGLVLPCAIDRSTYVAAGRRIDGRVAGWSAQRGTADPVAVTTGEPPVATGWIGYVAGVVWALAQLTGEVIGLDVVVASDVPVGAGLSSSAALSCATALAVAELTAPRALSRIDLARAAQRAEHEVARAPVGLMDQAASLLASPESALLLDCGSVEWTAVPFAPAAAGLTLLVVDSRVTHAHASGGYAARRAECERAAAGLGVTSLRDASVDDVDRLTDPVLRRRARHVVTENERVTRTVDVLRSGRLRDLGTQFAASHASLRDDFEVSTPELDSAVDAALAAGACAARMTGGGFGGSVLAIAETAAVGAVNEAVRAAFAAAGFDDPDVFAVQVAGGARRLDG